MLHRSLKDALKLSTHHQELREIMEYAVLPPGKLFRPRLVESIAMDLLGEVHDCHLHLANALEIHHAYTLVHDDLPSMDNDLIRRGRPSTHAAYGEWKAILAGDALLIASLAELMKIDHVRIRDLHRLFTWATGAKGLISGQFSDLNAKGRLSLEEVLRIHELKTARLIQVSTIGAYFLSSKKTSLKGLLTYMRIGREIGVSFQLLDDVTELTDAQVSDHEKEINPFLTSPQAAIEALKTSFGRLQTVLQEEELEHLKKMLNSYFIKNQQHLLGSEKILSKYINDPTVLKTLSQWLTTFV